MLEAFHLREEDAVRVSSADLRVSVQAMLEHQGMPKEDAALATDVLVSADDRAVDSHGVTNMLRTYIDGLAKRTINPMPNWRIVRERPSTATIDCDRGLGVTIAPKAMEIAIEKAKQTGMGMVTMARGGHVGMCAYHAMLALPHDMIGVCMTAATVTAPPTFGAEPRLGTNPIAVAAPARKEAPFVFDAATTTIAINKFRNAKRLGAKVPPGMFATTDGTPVMEPSLVPDSYYPLPLGSTREMGSHKGYGLAAVVEVLCAVLSGAGFVYRDGPYHHMVAAYAIDAFTDVDGFKDTMDEFLRTLRTTPPAPSHDRVLYPGMYEAEEAVKRAKDGIPLPYEAVEYIRTMCAEWGLPCPL